MKMFNWITQFLKDADHHTIKPVTDWSITYPEGVVPGWAGQPPLSIECKWAYCSPYCKQFHPTYKPMTTEEFWAERNHANAAALLENWTKIEEVILYE
jgi:hypothetical protein